MTPESSAKKDIQKLQRAIVDGLEDVKAQDLRVFNTEHLSPLFERVIVASGTSNRQTRALAFSVVDAVRDAGFPKPRLEGQDNGEWIIVDCGAAVAHIMQPAIRQYYQLEDIWGEKPVRIKLGAPKPAMPAKAASAAPKPTGTKKSSASTKASGDSKSGSPAKVRPAAKSSAAQPKSPAKAAPAKSRTAPSKGRAKPAATKAAAPGKAARAPAKTAAKAPARTIARKG